MARFGFTFGLGYNLRDNFAWVEADTEHDARVRFVEIRERAGALPASGRRWSSCFDEATMLRVAEQYHLTEVPVDTPIRWLDDANPLE